MSKFSDNLTLTTLKLKIKMIQLPFEIYLLILKDLDLDDRLNISCLSHYFRDLLSGLIFNHIVIDNKNHTISDLLATSGGTFLTRIGKHIRSLEYALYNGDIYGFSSSKRLIHLLKSCPNLKKISIVCVDTKEFPLHFVREEITQIEIVEFISQIGLKTQGPDDSFYKYRLKELIEHESINKRGSLRIDDIIMTLCGFRKDLFATENLLDIKELIPLNIMDKIFPNLKILFLRGFKISTEFIDKLNHQYFNELSNITITDCLIDNINAYDETSSSRINMQRLVREHSNIVRDEIEDRNTTNYTINNINIDINYSNFYKRLRGNDQILLF